MISHASRYDGLLRARDDEKERRKRDALRRIAPGFEPTGSVLVPTRTGTFSPDPPVASSGSTHQPPKSVMEDLVDQLAALDSSKGS